MMLTNEISLEHYQLEVKKLLAWGFVQTPEGYTCTRTLSVPSFTLQLDISADDRLTTKVTDLDVDEVYMLHLNAATQGEFVGKIRVEYAEILSDILTTCFSKKVFVARQSLAVIQFIKQQYQVDLEFLWAKFPQNAIARRQDNNKWFAALLTVEKSKLGRSETGTAEVLDLKMRPEDKPTLMDNPLYLPGYHMNKDHWFTVCLDGQMSDKELFSRIAESYLLAK